MRMDASVFGHNAYAVITIDEQEPVFERAVWSQTIATMSILNWNLATCLRVENCSANSAWGTIGMVPSNSLGRPPTVEGDQPISVPLTKLGWSPSKGARFGHPPTLEGDQARCVPLTELGCHPPRVIGSLLVCWRPWRARAPGVRAPLAHPVPHPHGQ